MKMYSRVLLFMSLVVLLVSGSALAVPSTLNDIMSGYGSYTDTGAQASILTDTDGINDDAKAFLLLEIAGYAPANSFGIYGFRYDANGNVIKGQSLEIFKGADDAIDSVTLRFDITAGSVTNQSTGASAVIGTVFGFYITTPGWYDYDNPNKPHTYYSHTFLNADGFDHMMIFDTSDSANGKLFGSDIVIAIEDLFGGGDKDYNDMVIGISDVSPAPVPEPATMLLLGTGLISLAGISRKKTKRS